MTIFQPSSRTKIVGFVAVLLTVAWVLQSANDAGGQPQSPAVAKEATVAEKPVEPYQKLGTYGVWDVLSSDTDGLKKCSFGAAYGNQKLLFTIVDGYRGVISIAVQKTSWNMPLHKLIDIYVSFDAQPPITLEGKAGLSDAIYADADKGVAVALLAGFNSRKMMTIRFGDLYQPSWPLPLKGSSQAVEALVLCMAQWQRMSK